MLYFHSVFFVSTARARRQFSHCVGQWEEKEYREAADPLVSWCQRCRLFIGKITFAIQRVTIFGCLQKGSRSGVGTRIVAERTGNLSRNRWQWIRFPSALRSDRRSEILAPSDCVHAIFDSHRVSVASQNTRSSIQFVWRHCWHRVLSHRFATRGDCLFPVHGCIFWLEINWKTLRPFLFKVFVLNLFYFYV